MKNKIVLFVTGCIFLILTSCLGSDESYEYDVSKDAQIASFKLSHENDSISKIFEDVKFTIDQLEGRIFNIDSLPFLTEIPELLSCEMTYTSGVTEVLLTPEATPDSTYAWTGNETDSINFTKPVKIVTTAWDGITKKTYIAQINVHQVDPDTMVWRQVAKNVTGTSIKEQKVLVTDYKGVKTYFMYNQLTSQENYKLFYSPVSDGVNWTETELSGLPVDKLVLSQITEFNENYFVPTTEGQIYYSGDGILWTVLEDTPFVRSIMGVVHETDLQEGRLAVIVEIDGGLYFAGMNSAFEFVLGENGINDNNNRVPAGFPLYGFGTISYSNMYYEHLMVIGGTNSNGNPINTAWATTSATYWGQLIEDNKDFFEPRTGVMAAQYDDMIYLIGGRDASGTNYKDIHFSIDKGISWTPMDSVNTKIALPEDYTARANSSIYIDDKDNMLIFGGKTSENSNVLDEIWSGRINRLGFKH